VLSGTWDDWQRARWPR